MGKSSQEDDITTKPSDVPVAENRAFKNEPRMTKSTDMPMSSSKVTSKDSLARIVAVANEHSGNNMRKLDEQINSLMTKSSSKNKNGQPIYVCNNCGTEGIHGQVRNHIEANHLEGISVPCNFCEKTFRSRNSKTTHVSVYHKGQQDLPPF